MPALSSVCFRPRKTFSSANTAGLRYIVSSKDLEGGYVRSVLKMLSIAFAAAVIAVPCAEAQWVMVARAVSGRIQQMSQKSENGSGYDVATVVLEAPANKVYSAAINGLKSHSEIKITKQDEKKQLIEFTNGTQLASMQATSLGPTVTQLVVASTLVPDQPSATSTVVQGVLHVCKQMNVDCTLQSQ